MVVKKQYGSSFRDVELDAAIQEYRAFMGWKTQDTTRKVGTGVTHCLLLGFYNGLERRGFTFPGWIIGTKLN